jgi:hypothetical protein
MYVCTYVCMYIRMYVYMYVCVYVCTYVRMWISKCIALPYYIIGIRTSMFPSVRSELCPVTEESTDRGKFTFVFITAKQTFEFRR